MGVGGTLLGNLSNTYALGKRFKFKTLSAYKKALRELKLKKTNFKCA